MESNTIQQLIKMSEITKISSKGQAVIPQDIREELGLEVGTTVIVNKIEDFVILKKINIPDLKKEFEELANYGKRHAKKLGIKTEKDVVRMIHEARGVKSD